MRTALVATVAIFLPLAAHADDSRALSSQAEAAYDAKDYARCSALFADAAKASRGGKTATALYSAACCDALGKKPDAALAHLGAAVDAGWRDDRQLTSDEDLVSLRGDKRFVAIVERTRVAKEKREKTANAELARLYDEDQGDRQKQPIDWSVVHPRDLARQKRTAEILAAGGAKNGDDYFHAAMVYQHGDAVADAEKARDLALKAADLDPDNDTARWLAAAATDRALMYADKPQKYATQFKKIDDKWQLWKVDPTVTDEERARWNCPPLAEAQKRAEAMNKSK